MDNSESKLPEKLARDSRYGVRFCVQRNFLKYPLFDTTKSSTRDTICIQETIDTEKGTVEFLWEVSRHLGRKFPGQLAAKIHRQVVERIVSEAPKPITRLIRLGSCRDICDMLGIEYTEQKAAEIEEALRDVQFTGVRAQCSLSSEGKSGYIDDCFYLYDRIISGGQHLPNGEVADAIYVVRGTPGLRLP